LSADTDRDRAVRPVDGAWGYGRLPAVEPIRGRPPLLGTLLAVALVLGFAGLTFWTDLLNLRYARRDGGARR
jgi:hypothetical protein